MPPKYLKQTLIILTTLLITISLLFLAAYLYCIHMPGTSFSDELPELSPGLLALRERLNEHVRILADEIGERHDQNRSALDQAAAYIETQLEAMDYHPVRQVFAAERYCNIVIDLSGQQRPDEIIVIGAHYDTVWLTPGADDNASGVAALLELARLLKDRPLARRVRLVAFANEEEPFYGTEKMGSLVNVRSSSELKEHIIGMFSLEMVGYYSDEPGSQFYPAPLSYFYPDRANFIAFVTNFPSRRFMATAIKAFRQNAQLPSVGLAAPIRFVPDIGRSDNASFWAHGYPAVMITDTSNFRNPNYHNVSDLPRTLDYERMALLVTGLAEMVESLANR